MPSGDLFPTLVHDNQDLGQGAVPWLVHLSKEERVRRGQAMKSIDVHELPGRIADEPALDETVTVKFGWKGCRVLYSSQAQDPDQAHGPEEAQGGA